MSAEWVCDGFIVHKKRAGDSHWIDLILSRHLYEGTNSVKRAGERFNRLRELCALSQGDFDAHLNELGAEVSCVDAVRAFRAGVLMEGVKLRNTPLYLLLDQSLSVPL